MASEICKECGTATDEARCHMCGGEVVSAVERSLTQEERELDLVSTASVPNLAALYKQGQAAGLIKPQQEYGHTA